MEDRAFDLAIKIVVNMLKFIVKLMVKIFRFIFVKDPKKVAAKAMFEAKNPVANRQLISFEKRGVFFGKQQYQYIAKPEDTDGHVLVVGGTGTGKSSCIAIPTIRNWQGAVFAIDIKNELYENTREHREGVKTFAPKSKESCGYDPFVFLKESANPAQEARAIAESIIPLPHDTREPFWIESAQLLLTGAILHYYSLNCTFIETLYNIQSHSPQALIKVVASSPNQKAALCVNSFIDMEGKVLASVSTEISRRIAALITDDEIIAALSPEKDREIISPMDLEKGHDIYIRIPEDLLRQWKNLLTLMVNQFITFFERRPESPYNRPILFLLDEFPRLGKIPAITDALATLRSKKITACIIIQSLAQLKMIYGHDAQEVIADTCAYKAVLGATDANTQKYFSDLVGTYEKIHNSNTQNFDSYVGAPAGSSLQTSQDNEKRIIKPEEFAYLRDIVLLYPLPFNFCRVQKQPYFIETGDP
jgi:type IV secretion system protein VirD4